LCGKSQRLVWLGRASRLGDHVLPAAGGHIGLLLNDRTARLLDRRRTTAKSRVSEELSPWETVQDQHPILPHSSSKRKPVPSGGQPRALGKLAGGLKRGIVMLGLGTESTAVPLRGTRSGCYSAAVLPLPRHDSASQMWPSWGYSGALPFSAAQPH
uniref:Uncharacterized protein n=1 Tax=Varanus komodoensis TaxID=61221 RepID=A0A8D2LAL1_VARKO